MNASARDVGLSTRVKYNQLVYKKLGLHYTFIDVVSDSGVEQ